MSKHPSSRPEERRDLRARLTPLDVEDKERDVYGEDQPRVGRTASGMDTGHSVSEAGNAVWPGAGRHDRTLRWGLGRHSSRSLPVFEVQSGRRHVFVPLEERSRGRHQLCTSTTPAAPRESAVHTGRIPDQGLDPAVTGRATRLEARHRPVSGSAQMASLLGSGGMWVSYSHTSPATG